MPKARKKKNSSFQTTITKSVFLYGRPNKEKLVILQQMQNSYTALINRDIDLLEKNPDIVLQLVKNDKKDPQMRKLEKAIRPEGINSAFCQNAFDAAVVQVSGRLNNIRQDLLSEGMGIFAQSKVLFAMSIMGCLKQKMEETMRQIEGTFYEDCAKTLHEMSEKEFSDLQLEFQERYATKSLEYRVPKLRFVSVPLDLRLMKIEQSTDTKMPYVIIITNPLKTRQRITIPLDTSGHFLHKIQNNKMAGMVLMQIRKGNLRIGWSYDSTRQQPATTNCIGVDTGISDCFHTSDGRAIGSMSPVIDFYHEAVEPAFAELANLRNKKRKIKHFLRKHDLPEDVRRSLIKKMDKLNRMIQKANAPYRKKRHYYQMLDKEIKDAVLSYVSSLDKETITVLELLDIREFNKSRRVNGMFSCFARGKAQQKLMQTLNWKGFDFVEVVPDYTSQVCPECSNLDKANRNGKSFLCTCCGYKGDADHTAGINIKARYLDKNLSKICEDNKYNHKVLQSKLSGYYSRKNELYKQQHPEKFVKKQNSEEQAASAT